MRESDLASLLENAANGDPSAWAEIVKRYTPFVAAICRRCGVRYADAEDVAGIVWLRLVTNVTLIRDAEALPAWLATTTRRECVHLRRDKRREIPADVEIIDRPEPEAEPSFLADERRQVVREAYHRLPERDRTLLTMLFADPPAPYTTISAKLGMPIGAIGPTRQRCLARMRGNAAITALFADEDHRWSA